MYLILERNTLSGLIVHFVKKMSKRSPSSQDVYSSNSSLVPGNRYEIQQAGNACWSALLLCQDCKTHPSHFSCLDDMKFFLHLYCVQCDSAFYVCTICPLNRKQFFTMHDMSKHERCRSHQRNLKKIMKRQTIIHDKLSSLSDSRENHDDEEIQFETNDNEESLVSSSNNSVQVSTDVIHTETQSHLKRKGHFYFLWESLSLGNNFLYTQSYFPHQSIINNTHDQDADFNLLLGQFIFQLSKSLQHLFLKVLNGMKPYMLPNADVSGELHSLKIPFQHSKLRLTYLDGKNSLRNLLPVPNVQIMKSSHDESIHSYASLLDCLEHFLGFGNGIYYLEQNGNEFNGREKISHLSETRRAHDISNTKEDTNNILTTGFTVFSDAFDPTVSLVKANRHGVWVLQVCFLRNQKESMELENTYVISLGPKDANHDTVLRKLEDEIEILRSGKCPKMYYGGTKKLVLPVLQPILRHADQPERRQLYGLKLGKGSNSARWRYSANYDVIGKYLPSCIICKEKIENIVSHNFNSLIEVESLNTCEQCSNWELLQQKPFLFWCPPRNYPSDMVPNNGFLKPMQITIQKLKFAATITHDNVSNGNWSSEEAYVFLSQYCISTKLADDIIDNALNIWIVKKLKEDNDPMLPIVLDNKEKYPEKYMAAPLPPLWNSTDNINIYPDSPMHLFSGTVKAVLNLTFYVLKKKHRFTPFLKSIGSHMDNIDNLHLSWFPLLRIKSENFPGIGSENYIAIGRYMKILATYLQQTKESSPIVFPPDSTQKSWTKQLNLEWLKLRNLPTNGKAIELRERVQMYMNDPNCPSPVNHSNVTIEEVIRMMASTFNLLSHVMATSANDLHIEKTYLSVKRCLNDIENVDNKIRNETDKPVWVQKYNLLCLLNTKEDMTLYGVPRRRWEGDENGEKNIQSLKLTFNGYHVNWHKNLHENSMCNKTIDKLTSGTNRKKLKHESTFTHLLRTHTYPNPQTISSHFCLRNPLKMIRTVSNQFGLIHSTNLFWSIAKMKFIREESFLSVFSFELNPFDSHDPIDVESIANICIAIPQSSTNITTNAYSILDMEWKELDHDLQFRYGYK